MEKIHIHITCVGLVIGNKYCVPRYRERLHHPSVGTRALTLAPPLATLPSQFENRAPVLKKLTLFASFVLIALFVSVSDVSAGNIRVEPVVFGHPDEVIRGDGFIVLADRRVFSVFAFMNAAGYDKEADGKEMHPVRVKVRKLMEANLTEPFYQLLVDYETASESFAEHLPKMFAKLPPPK